MNASVSVIIPAFNAASTLTAAIESAMAQTHRAGEIVVVDDGSTDGTADAVSRFGPAVRYVRKPNGGPASARNLGARLATGEWLAMLDADDSWLPRKLERQLALDTSPSIGIIHSLIDPSIGRPLPNVVTFRDLWAGNCIVNSTVLLRRVAFEHLGGFDEDPALISVEDYNLWLRVAAAGWTIVTCREKLCHYSLQAQSLSRQTRRFMTANIANIHKVGGSLYLPRSMVRAKLAEAYAAFGIAFVSQRDLDSARQAFGRALAIRPTVRQSLWYAATFIPRPLLDFRRRYLVEHESHDVSVSASAQPASSPSSMAGHEVPPPPRARKADRRMVQAEEGTLPRNGLLRLPHATHETVLQYPANEPPLLLTFVDAEEEFDWHAPLSASETSVATMRYQFRAQRIFEKFSLAPTYLLDYAVASCPDGYMPIREYLSNGECKIGAQLHPWVNPPLEEPISIRNSFAGNLPPTLERRKLSVLTETIAENFGALPRVYRAGRYGIGPNTADILEELRYVVDTSIRPARDYSRFGGPDFRRHSADPFWFGPNGQVLELPLSSGYTGLLTSAGGRIYRMLESPIGRVARLQGILARCSILDRVDLTPEGSTLTEAIALTRTMVSQGLRVFVLSYHSPSLEPGHTPYVRNQRDLDCFLYWIEAYLTFFLGEMNGRTATPEWLHEVALTARSFARQD